MPKTSAQIQESPSLWSDNELHSEIKNYPDQGPKKIAEKHLHVALGETGPVFRSTQRILLALYMGRDRSQLLSRTERSSRSDRRCSIPA